MLRTLGAFLVAPFPVALFQAIVVGLWPKEGQGVFENPPSMFLAICIYFYLFGVLIGVPAWLIMKRRRVMGPRDYALIGLLVGLLPIGSALFVTLSRGHASTYEIAYNMMLFGVGGLVAGELFGRITSRGPRGQLDRARGD